MPSERLDGVRPRKIFNGDSERNERGKSNERTENREIDGIMLQLIRFDVGQSDEPTKRKSGQPMSVPMIANVIVDVA
jgi:hypothetical protein